MNDSASLALEVHPRLTPGAFLVPFCASKKELAVRRNLTVSFGKTKEMGSEKQHLKDAVLETGKGASPCKKGPKDPVLGF